MRRSFVVLAALAASCPLFAQVSVVLPEFGTVRAGETVTIEWRGLPERVEELELLLEVEGHAESIRMTPQLAAAAGLISWRVPNLPAPVARLTIRFGLDGDEVESPPSAPFAILPSGSEPPAALTFHEGEWWEQESAGSPLRGSLGAASGGDRLQENREAAPAADSPPEGALTRGPTARASKFADLVPRPARPRFLLSRQPAEVPARI